MQRLAHHLVAFSLLGACLASLALCQTQQPLGHGQSTAATAISVPFFAALERLARLVDISYCIGTSGVRKPFQCLSRCKEFPGVALVVTWNTGVLLSDSCGYIAVDHGDEGRPAQKQTSQRGSIIVAFRGTYSLTNTVVDLSTVPQEYVPYPSPDDGGDGAPKGPERECQNCTVHMGFLASWKNARGLVLPELKRLRKKHPSYPIQLVGHSLGGSVACLAALEMKVSLGWEDLVVTTFGEPRVGNYQLARFVDEVFQLGGQTDLESRAYRRVTHNDDPVPLLPLSEWGYRSHAGEIYISKKDLSPSETDIQMCVGDVDPECSAGADTTFRDTLRRLLHFTGLPKSTEGELDSLGFPTRFKLWELFFAHRDYFWRLGLCVPGGDPADWWRDGHRIWESEQLDVGPSDA